MHFLLRAFRLLLLNLHLIHCTLYSVHCILLIHCTASDCTANLIVLLYPAQHSRFKKQRGKLRQKNSNYMFVRINLSIIQHFFIYQCLSGFIVFRYVSAPAMKLITQHGSYHCISYRIVLGIIMFIILEMNTKDFARIIYYNSALCYYAL